jgi:hypothetical protein
VRATDQTPGAEPDIRERSRVGTKDTKRIVVDRFRDFRGAVGP